MLYSKFKDVITNLALIGLWRSKLLGSYSRLLGLGLAIAWGYSPIISPFS